MKIGEFAQAVGVAPSTLRYYEDVGLLPDVPRIHQQRWYPERYVAIVRFIQNAKQTGFTLEETREMLALFQYNESPADEDWKPMVEQKLHEIETAIAQYQQMRAALLEVLTCDVEALTLEMLTEPVCEYPE